MCCLQLKGLPMKFRWEIKNNDNMYYLGISRPCLINNSRDIWFDNLWFLGKSFYPFPWCSIWIQKHTHTFTYIYAYVYIHISYILNIYFYKMIKFYMAFQTSLMSFFPSFHFFSLYLFPCELLLLILCYSPSEHLCSSDLTFLRPFFSCHDNDPFLVSRILLIL